MAERGRAGKPPVFIVGSPRSGTTLLRNILTRHPALAICNETRFFADVYRRRSIFGPLENPNNRRRLVEQYVLTARARRLGLDLDGLSKKLLQEATGYQAFFTCILQYHAASQGKSRFGEKTPYHAFVTETLCEWYPGALIIHLVRDPRSVVESLQRFAFAPKSIVNNAWLWRLFNRAARRSHLRPEYLLVSYERLVARPEQELARICEHLGEDYAPELLAPGEGAAGPYSWPRSSFGPVIEERLDQWRTKLSTQEVAWIECIAAEDMKVYGYERSVGRLSLAGASQGVALAALDLFRSGVSRLPYAWSRLAQPTNLARQEYWRYKQAWESVFPGLPPLLDRPKGVSPIRHGQAD